MITYADALMGQVLAALKAPGQVDDTIIIVSADHGEMLGERGLWYKMTFFERSVRVPLIMHAPKRFGPRRIKQNVSLVDVLPTLLELGGATQKLSVPVDGRSLLPLAGNGAVGWPDTVYAEYMAEGTTEPVIMIRRGRHKYIACAGDPPQLFDVENDPLELENLSEKREHRSLAAGFASEASSKWNSEALRASIVDSQRQRVLVQQGPAHRSDPPLGSSTAARRRSTLQPQLWKRVVRHRPACPAAVPARAAQTCRALNTWAVAPYCVGSMAFYLSIRVG
jgi:choline-sulfatase